MNHNATDISIFVPTFNRSELLDYCLKSIIRSVQKYSIPIWVSDNHSRDNTENIVKSHQKTYSHLKYIKQIENIGLDRNQLAFIDCVETKYCLMIADDDALIENGFEQVMKFIEGASDYDLILLNCDHYTGDMKSHKRKNFDLKEDIEYDTPVNFLRDYIFAMHFSTLVVRMNHIKKDRIEVYDGSYHAYCGLVFDALSEKWQQTEQVKIKIIADPVIKIRDGEKTYSMELVDVLYNRFPSFFANLPGLYEEVSKAKLRELMNSHTGLIALGRLRQKGLLKRKSRPKFYEYLNSIQKARVVLLSETPLWFLSFLEWSYHKLKPFLRLLKSKFV